MDVSPLMSQEWLWPVLLCSETEPHEPKLYKECIRHGAEPCAVEMVSGPSISSSYSHCHPGHLGLERDLGIGGLPPTAPVGCAQWGPPAQGLCLSSPAGVPGAEIPVMGL